MFDNIFYFCLLVLEDVNVLLGVPPMDNPMMTPVTTLAGAVGPGNPPTAADVVKSQKTIKYVFVVFVFFLPGANQLSNVLIIDRQMKRKVIGPNTKHPMVELITIMQLPNRVYGKNQMN